MKKVDLSLVGKFLIPPPDFRLNYTSSPVRNFIQHEISPVKIYDYRCKFLRPVETQVVTKLMMMEAPLYLKFFLFKAHQASFSTSIRCINSQVFVYFCQDVALFYQQTRVKYLLSFSNRLIIQVHDRCCSLQSHLSEEITIYSRKTRVKWVINLQTKCTVPDLHLQMNEE